MVKSDLLHEKQTIKGLITNFAWISDQFLEQHFFFFTLSSLVSEARTRMIPLPPPTPPLPPWPLAPPFSRIFTTRLSNSFSTFSPDLALVSMYLIWILSDVSCKGVCVCVSIGVCVCVLCVQCMCVCACVCIDLSWLLLSWHLFTSAATLLTVRLSLRSDLLPTRNSWTFGFSM